MMNSVIGAPPSFSGAFHSRVALVDVTSVPLKSLGADGTAENRKVGLKLDINNIHL